MLALEFYKGYFEEAFLSETQVFFKNDSVEKMAQLNVRATYLI